MVFIYGVDCETINRCELFDETDLNAARARLEELHRPVRRLENAASRVEKRSLVCFAARDWDSMHQFLADDLSFDDRRRVVNAGTRSGRYAAIADARAVAELGGTHITSEVIATRGERLHLSRTHLSSLDEGSQAFHTESLCVTEIDADDRISSRVIFDPDNLDAALAEVDARYLAGEAAAHAQMWSEITQGYAALNGHELPSATSDWVTVDHRVRATFEAGDLAAYIGSVWDIALDVKIYIETVHRLSNLGAVYTQAAYGTSEEGFEAEWRAIALAVGAEPKNRCEVYDEADLDAALARFDELSLPTSAR